MSTTKLKRNMMETTREKWSFDRHGINITGGERSGERIAKVSLEQYDYSSGTPVRNVDFDNTSNVIAAAPELLEALEDLTTLITNVRDVYQNAAGKWLTDSGTYADAIAAISKAKGVL